MVLVKEFRVVMPMTLEEYQIGQLYSVAKTSNLETHDDAGVEILKNEPFENEESKGQYTHKIYHLGSRVPGWLRALAPASALMLEEEAWNAFPYCKTVLTSPFMADKFKFIIETRHFADRGDRENAHGLDKKELKKRDVELIDITTQVDKKEYKEEEDPTLVRSEKAGRGPLQPGWIESADPVMCAYKMVTVEFKWWGLQTKIENFMMSMETNIFLKFHKQVYCWMDEWFGMTMEEVRKFEDELREQMTKKMEDIKAQGTEGEADK
eukprot:TRINITY_DN323_c0_g1_i1.p1 TRINITY_DN323_c0_g1~~TRINITY_DN323_c0_g1_i1.p1  ORF type:complete len:301 (-),score=74.81 TRINITY_DN323_c0_g1_i1:85-882(-)